MNNPAAPDQQPKIRSELKFWLFALTLLIGIAFVGWGGLMLVFGPQINATPPPNDVLSPAAAVLIAVMVVTIIAGIWGILTVRLIRKIRLNRR